jgi:hypothetical protein
VARSISVTGLVLALIGVAVGCRRHLRPNAVALVLSATFIVFISSLSLRWSRWIVPVLPYVSLYAAAGLVTLARAAASVVPRRSAAAAAATGALLTGVVATPLVGAIERNHTERVHDTRMVAGAWLLANVPRGSILLMEAYAPELPRGHFEYLSVAKDGRIAPPREPRWGSFRAVGNVGDMTDLGEVFGHRVEYLVLSNWFERYAAEAARYPAALRNYHAIMAMGSEIYRVEPSRGRLGGPTIRVLRVGPQLPA